MCRTGHAENHFSILMRTIDTCYIAGDDDHSSRRLAQGRGYWLTGAVAPHVGPEVSV